MSRFLCPLTIALCLTAASSALAVDAIYRTNGSTDRGTITTFTKSEINLNQGNRETKIPVNEVVRINWDKEPAALKNARSHELAGNLKQALDLYNQVKGNSSDLSDGAKSDIDYLIVRTQARQAIVDPSQADAAITALEQFKRDKPNHFRYYDLHEFLGRVHAAKGDIDQAKSAFNEMASAPFGDLKMAAKNLTAEALFNAGDIAGAQGAYGEVVNMPASTQEETNRKNQARLGQAVCLTQQSQGAKAVELCEQVIADSTPQQADVQGEAFLRKGDALVAIENEQKAIVAYLAVDLLFESQPALHAEALYRLSELWNKVGRQDRASDAKARLQNQYPESRWLAQAQ